MRSLQLFWLVVAFFASLRTAPAEPLRLWPLSLERMVEPGSPTAATGEPRRELPLAAGWRRVLRHASCGFTSAKNRSGHAGTGLIVKVTLMRF